MNLDSISVESIRDSLRERKYICDRSLATVVYLSVRLGKPILLEGEAGAWARPRSPRCSRTFSRPG